MSPAQLAQLATPVLDEVVLAVLGAAALVGVLLGLAVAFTRSPRRTRGGARKSTRSGGGAARLGLRQRLLAHAAAPRGMPAGAPMAVAGASLGTRVVGSAPGRVRFTPVHAPRAPAPAPAPAPRRAASAATIPAGARGRASMQVASVTAATTSDPDRGLRLTRDALWGMRTGKATRGTCSRCQSTLWLSAKRPLLARCPVCGHSRVLQ